LNQVHDEIESLVIEARILFEVGIELAGTGTVGLALRLLFLLLLLFFVRGICHLIYLIILKALLHQFIQLAIMNDKSQLSLTFVYVEETVMPDEGAPDLLAWH
jgi:hypothetical protein